MELEVKVLIAFFIIVLYWAFYLLDASQKLKDELRDQKFFHNDLKSDMRDLFWAMGNQTEKVKDKIIFLVDKVFKDSNLKVKTQVIDDLRRKKII